MNYSKIIFLFCCLCTFLLYSCSDDSSNSLLVLGENYSSSEVVESSSEDKIEYISSEQKGKLSSSNIIESSSEYSDIKSSSSKNPDSSTQNENSNLQVTNDSDWRDTCLDIINEYRLTENLSPLSLAVEEKQICTENQAYADLAENAAHGHFGDCGEGAQNTGPNVYINKLQSNSDYVKMYLKMMWEDEKALVTAGKANPEIKEDYSKIGHYLNMKGNFKSVACGFALSSDKKKGWLNINFFR